MPNAKMYWLHALSPTHVGAGRGVGYIDLPLHRDKVTNWPLIPGSAFKGVWADKFGATEARRNATSHDGKLLRAAFGRGGDDSSNAGALVPTDARLVCLPVRSLHGTFAWCTSQLALQMLKRDLDSIGMNGTPASCNFPQDGKVQHAKITALKDGKIYLEDLDFPAQSNDLADEWAGFLAQQIFRKESAWAATFKERFAVLPDAAFDFLTGTGTQVDARVKIDDHLKTVVPGALWTEESLPTETILAGFVVCDRVYGQDPPKAEELLNAFAEKELTLQIGGKATVGRGRVRCIFGGNS